MCSKTVYTITNGETGYSVARTQVPTWKKVDLLKGRVTSSCGTFFAALFAGQRLTVACFHSELGETAL